MSSFVSLSLCLRRNACIFKFDVFGLCFDPSRFVLMDQINSAGDIADYGDFMLNRQWVKLHETLNQCESVEADTKCRWIFHNTQTHALSLSLSSLGVDGIEALRNVRPPSLESSKSSA